MIRTKHELNKQKIYDKVSEMNDKLRNFYDVDKEYHDYLWYLMDEPLQTVYDEKNGEEYQAVTLLNHNGMCKTYGLSVLMELYLSYHKRASWNLLWMGLLEKLTFINNKLKLIGNHSAAIEVTWDYVVEKFIEFHMSQSRSDYYHDWEKEFSTSEEETYKKSLQWLDELKKQGLTPQDVVKKDFEECDENQNDNE
ncbi:MAG: hypothetical protein LBC44_00515 [Mycoplasmataceae bacterium]|nr:hypothetical protein [Mycoplasmataceae bacterium]